MRRGRAPPHRPRGPSRARMGSWTPRGVEPRPSHRSPRRANSTPTLRRAAPRRCDPRPCGCRPLLSRRADPLERQRSLGERRRRGAAHRPTRASSDEGGAPVWWVLDYKLHHAPEALEPYREQLLRYRDVVRTLQPGEKVRWPSSPAMAGSSRSSRSTGARTARRPGMKCGRDVAGDLAAIDAFAGRYAVQSATSAHSRCRSLPPTAFRSSPTPTRAFGRFQLRRLLGKSDATMTWLALDSRHRRRGDADDAARAARRRRRSRAWLLAARRAPEARPPQHRRRRSNAASTSTGPSSSIDRRAGVTLDEWLAQHPRAGCRGAGVWIGGVLRGLAFAHEAGVAHLDLQLHNVLVNERGADQRDGARRRAGRRGRRRAAASRRQRRDAARPLDAARRSAPRRSATCWPAACCCTAADRRARRSASPTPPASSIAWRRAAASSCACPGPRRIRSPKRCARSSTAAPPARSGCAIAAHEPSSARSTAGAKSSPKTTAARWRCCSIACTPSAICPRFRGLARVQRVTNARASAPTRSRAICCPTGAVVRAPADAQLRAGAGHAGRRQRTGAHPAPGRRAHRRRRRALPRTAFAPGPARSTTMVPGRCSAPSTACASPATWRRRCARPATTPRSSTSSP